MHEVMAANQEAPKKIEITVRIYMQHTSDTSIFGGCCVETSNDFLYFFEDSSDEMFVLEVPGLQIFHSPYIGGPILLVGFFSISKY